MKREMDERKREKHIYCMAKELFGKITKRKISIFSTPRTGFKRQFCFSVQQTFHCECGKYFCFAFCCKKKEKYRKK